MKHLFLFCILMLCLHFADAQNATYFYVNQKGEPTARKDSAVYIRILVPPQQVDDSNLWSIMDRYPNGKLKMTTHFYKVFKTVTYQGIYTEYYPTGKIKNVFTYEKGRQKGPQYYYFPNGKLYTHQIYDNGDRRIIQESRDSLGNVLVDQGEGQFLVYDSLFHAVIEQGPVKKGLKHGLWIKQLAGNERVECWFKNGQLNSGDHLFENGTKKHFDVLDSKAFYPEGLTEFYRVIRERIKKRNDGILPPFLNTVPITIHFTVKTDGSLNDFHSTPGDTDYKGYDQVIINAMVGLKWKPAVTAGIPRETSTFLRFVFVHPSDDDNIPKTGY